MDSINRHNYETFFLLYIDNELPVAEKRTVEEFVKANPDLQQELVMLQQSIVQPDNIIFDDKNNLIRNEFTATAIQEKLLLHLDNELKGTEKNEIEKLIKTDVGIENEWKVLLQTKLLPAGTIVFEDKQSLYRKEAGRVVSFPWRRVAAAAVFIGFGVWGSLVYFSDKPIVAVKETASNTTTTIDTSKPVVQKEAIPVDSFKLNKKDIAVTKSANKKSPEQKPLPMPVKPLPYKLTGTEKQFIVVKKKDNNLPKPYFEIVNIIDSNKTNTATVTPKKQLNNIDNPGNNVIAKKTDQQDTATPFAVTTSYSYNTEDSNNDRVLFMDEEKIKKTKIGGMFRKVKRLLERNTNIKSGGNNIKVANLEFAIQ